MESIDHQPKLITIRPKIQHNDYDGYIVSGGSSVKVCKCKMCVHCTTSALSDINPQSSR